MPDLLTTANSATAAVAASAAAEAHDGHIGAVAAAAAGEPITTKASHKESRSLSFVHPLLPTAAAAAAQVCCSVMQSVTQGCLTHFFPQTLGIDREGLFSPIDGGRRERCLAAQAADFQLS